jgi:hypothetical protein
MEGRIVGNAIYTVGGLAPLIGLALTMGAK